MQNEEEKKLHEDYYAKSDNSGFSRYQWFAEKFFRNSAGGKILEIGCGDGGVVQYLGGKNKVFAADISRNAVKFSKLKGVESFLVDVSKENLPFDDQSIDAVIALEVLEHLKSPQNAIEEIQRVLKKNGKLVVSIPNPRTGHKFLYPSLFEYENFKNYLLNNGFAVLSTTTYGICPPFWKQIRRLIVREKKRQHPGGMGKLSVFLPKVSRFFSSGFLVFIRPKMFGWSFVYECLNENPKGSKSIYEQIVDETKKKE